MGKNKHRAGSGGIHTKSATSDSSSPPANPEPSPAFSISYPPDHIFKYRGNPQSPSSELIKGNPVTYVPREVIYDEGKGIFLYYQDVEHPTKGHVFPQAIYAMNGVKRLLINSLKAIATKDALFPMIGFALMPKRAKVRLAERVLKSFNDSVDMMFMPYYLKDGYYCKTAKEVRVFVRVALMEFGVELETADRTGEILGAMFEYDNAYRYRFQDLMTEANRQHMLDNLPAEISRLFVLEAERDKAWTVANKLGSVEKLIKTVWGVPSLRKAIRTGLIAVHFENWRLDEADTFHMMLIGDYDMGGYTVEQRIEAYKKMYEGKKLPTRVEIVAA